MNRARPRLLIRVLLAWTSALAVSAGYLALLSAIAPEILLREGVRNHNDLYRLAEKNNRQVRRLRWVLPAAEKIRLLDEAVAALEEATAQRPESQYYFWFLGQNLYLRAQQEDSANPVHLDRALDALHKSWDLTHREWDKPGVFLARHYSRNDRPAQAEEILNHIVSIHPQSPEAYSILLDLYFEQDRNDEALALLQAKRDNLSLSVSDQDRIGDLYLKKGDYPAAIEIYKNLVTGGGGNSRHFLLLAGALRTVGEFEESFRILRDFIEPLKRDKTLRPASSFGLKSYPKELFPPLSYLWLEGKLKPLP